MINPIYINIEALTDTQLEVLKQETNRPVVLINGDPRTCVLDLQEELRDKFALVAFKVLLEQHFNSNFKALDEVIKSLDGIIRESWKMADMMVEKRDK